ncbi:putative gamma-glutamylcyclotransferase CG2811 isoform X2 [Lineus longissimus]|uniref:putative gamma-glutamylcyclotransferase CG2811 isoform X2 n=1 Tax=Lineus longissimus TaxID=88925 RepID=UPI002B4D72A1
MTNYTRVLVYGTLLRGQPNHYLIQNKDNGEAKYIGIGQLQDRRPLVTATPYNIPFLLDVPGEGENITGEIFDVDDKMLKVLDDLENHPNFYQREIIPFTFKKDSQDKPTEDSTGSAWVYLMKEFNKKMLQLPFLKSYDSNDHLRSYKKSEEDLEDLSVLHELIEKEVDSM